MTAIPHRTPRRHSCRLAAGPDAKRSRGLEPSAALGGRLAAILDPDVSVSGVSAGTIDPRLSCLGVLTRVDRRALTLADLTVSAGWGHRMETGVVMPGGGKIDDRDAYTENEAAILGEEAIRVLGLPLDIRLNTEAAWRTVPRKVWNYKIGGYQVIKKWLSYRDENILGRALTKEESREVTAMVRRIAAIILMTAELDNNYITIRDMSFSWIKEEQ